MPPFCYQGRCCEAVRTAHSQPPLHRSDTTVMYRGTLVPLFAYIRISCPLDSFSIKDSIQQSVPKLSRWLYFMVGSRHSCFSDSVARWHVKAHERKPRPMHPNARYLCSSVHYNCYISEIPIALPRHFHAWRHATEVGTESPGQH